ncbi:MAG: glycosyltransferase [Nocardioides sp.]|nr:glycosyltransferase [Nocardioides sp.]
MRVAIVTDSFHRQNTRGTASDEVTDAVRHTVDHLVDNGHTALVVTPGPGLADYRGVPVHRTGGASARTVHRVLAKFGPDVVHLPSPGVLGGCGLVAARRLGVPVLASHHTDVTNRARQRWVREVYARADRTLAPSRSAYEHLRGLGARDVQLWQPGVGLDLFSPAMRDPLLHAHWAREARPGGPRVVVGYVGALERRKQVRRLLEVARVPGTRVVVVGDGSERSWLAEHLPDVVLTGPLRRDALAHAVASLDVLVHPGETQTVCHAVREAQASGVPVIAPAAGGAVDAVRHDRTGLLYDPGDPRGLRTSVATLVGSPGTRDRLAAAALAVRHPDWPVAAATLVEVHCAAVVREGARTRAA